MKRSSKFRIFAVGLAVALILGIFVGCAPKVDDSAVTSAETTPKTDNNEGAVEGQSDEVVTLKYVSWMTNGEDIPYIEKFNAEHPNIKVEAEALDGSNYDKLLKVRLMSNDAPDVFLIEMHQYAKYVSEGYLADVSAQPSTTLVDTNQSVREALTIDEKIYGFPINTNGGPIPIYYNKVYFDSLGITELPETVEEFYALCDIIKADGIEPLVFGDQDSWVFEMFFRYRHYTGLLGEYPEWGEAIYNGDVMPSEFFANEFKMAQEMYDRGYISKSSLTLTWPQSVPYFIEGKAAMLPQGPWVPGLDEIKAADPSVFQLACFISPSDVDPVTNKKMSTSNVDRMMVISSQTKHAEAANTFYNWFVSEENLKAYLEDQSLITFLDFDYDVDPVLSDYVKTISSDEYQLILKQNVSLASGFLTDACFKAFQNILAGSPAETELENLNVEFEKTRSGSVINT